MATQYGKAGVMAKQNADRGGSLLQELLRADVYKRNQGKVARQVTFAVLAGTVALAAWQVYVGLSSSWLSRYSVPVYISQLSTPLIIGLGLLIAGVWFSYRLVNLPRFADFLIAVEAEMNKVSWPSWLELKRSAMVVIFVIFAMAFLLYGYDIAWTALFRQIGILRGN